MPFFIRESNGASTQSSGCQALTTSGFPASGSSYLPRLPIHPDSGMLRLLSPVTAAGPRRIFTVFPF